MSDLAVFEFAFLAADGAPLQIGIVEAMTLGEAIREVGEFHQADADAVKFTVRELDE